MYSMMGGDGIGIKNMQLALSRWTSANADAGIATGGSNTTVTDTRKDWPVNVWAAGRIKIIKANGQEYDRAIASNTATQITFAALPGVITVDANDIYSVRSSVAVLDVSDRWARQLGQIDLARVLGAALAHANPVIVRLTQGVAFDSTLGDIHNQLVPLEKAAEHNTAELANTDILGAALTPTNTPCLFRVQVAFDAAGVFNVTITRGGNTQTVHFNNGGALGIGNLYIFDHLVHSGDSINYQYSVNATLQVLRVQEIVGGVQ